MTEVYKIEKYKDQIREYAVRLDDSNETGSGFLFAPEGSRFLYIFTALHVVIKMFAPGSHILTVGWKGEYCEYDGLEVDICTLYPELEQRELAGLSEEEVKKRAAKINEELQEDTNSERNKDIAVLRLHENKFQSVVGVAHYPYYMNERELLPEMPFLGFGYPDKKTFPLRLDGCHKGWDEEKKLWNCQAAYQGDRFVEAMRGFSGTGLAVDYHGRLVLAGIVTFCDSQELHQCFCAVGVSEIICRMEEIGWEVPDRFGEGKPPADFFELRNGLKADLSYMLEDKVKTELMREFYNISKKYSPMDMVPTEKFYDIPVCTAERQACPVYWRGRLWTIYIHELLSESGKEEYFLSKDGKNLCMEFICTEGKGNADISTVVASAIRQNVLGTQIKGDSILIWQSEKNPDIPFFNKKRFKRIVENIAKGNIYGMEDAPEREGYDLLAGEMREKNYGIVHIKYLLTNIMECESKDEIKEKIAEALDNVWK